MTRAEQVVRLFMEGKSYKDIAIAMNLTPYTVQVAVYRLRRQGVKLPYRKCGVGVGTKPLDVGALNAVVASYRRVR